MNLIAWANPKIKRLSFWDIQLIKLSVAGFILMLVKFWEPLISLNWYWYALIFIVAAIKPWLSVLQK